MARPYTSPGLWSSHPAAQRGCEGRAAGPRVLKLGNLSDHVCQPLLPQRDEATRTGSPSSGVSGLALPEGNPRGFRLSSLQSAFTHHSQALPQLFPGETARKGALYKHLCPAVTAGCGVQEACPTF